MSSETSVPEDVADAEIGPVPESTPVYRQIRDDILEGRLAASERLKVSALAQRYGTSTNPVREALQQLRGEGFVVFSHNRGARVRAIDEDFVRDIYEMEVLIEPFLVGWFVSIATDADIEALESIQAQIETLGFDDHDAYSALDEKFHRTLYDRHYNRHAVDLWWRHREILRAISRRFTFARARRQAIVTEHRQVIEAIKQHDARLAAEVMATHVAGSGRHIVEHMRAARNQRPPV